MPVTVPLTLLVFAAEYRSIVPTSTPSIWTLTMPCPGSVTPNCEYVQVPASSHRSQVISAFCAPDEARYAAPTCVGTLLVCDDQLTLLLDDTIGLMSMRHAPSFGVR